MISTEIENDSKTTSKPKTYISNKVQNKASIGLILIYRLSIIITNGKCDKNNCNTYDFEILYMATI